MVEDDAWDLTGGEQGAGVPGIFASLLTAPTSFHATVRLRVHPLLHDRQQMAKKSGSTFCTFSDRASDGSWSIGWLDLQTGCNLSTNL